MPDAKGNYRSCTTPWGDKLEHGQGTLAYEKDMVEYGEELKTETRFCNDGNLSGSFGQKTGRSLAKGDHLGS